MRLNRILRCSSSLIKVFQVDLAYLLTMDTNANFIEKGDHNTSAGAGGGGIKLQDPSADVKPRVPVHIVPTLVWRLFGLKVTNMKELPSYDDINYFFDATPEYDNEHIEGIHPGGYVLKVLNSLQSSDPTIIEAQHAFQQYVRERGISTQDVVLNRRGREWSTETFPASRNTGTSFNSYIVRVVTYIPGKIFHATPYVAGSFYNVGKFVGRLHTALQGFHHEFYDSYTSIWSLTQVPQLRRFLHAIPDDDDRRIVEDIITAFETDVVPKYDQFQKAIVHGDLNEQNIIMAEVPGQDETSIDERVHDVSGILDFADSNAAYLAMDVATCIAYLSIGSPTDTELDVGGHILAGYQKYGSLNKAETSSLKILICSRLCQSLVLGAHAFMLQPGNTYLLTTAARGWPLLRHIWLTDDASLYKRWENMNEAYKTIC